MQRRLLSSLLLLPLGLACGCATQQPWTKAGLDDWNTPADKANLRLFDAKSRGDFLVVYDEYSGWNDSVRTRAYFLNQNDKRILHDRAPHFVSTNLAGCFPAIPVVADVSRPKPLGTNQIQKLSAIMATNEPSFIIHSGNQELGSHQLPVYQDLKDAYEGAASTAVKTTVKTTGEAALVVGAFGGYMALMYVWALGQSGYAITVH